MKQYYCGDTYKTEYSDPPDTPKTHKQLLYDFTEHLTFLLQFALCNRLGPLFTVV